jgi:hypothetical protein
VSGGEYFSSHPDVRREVAVALSELDCASNCSVRRNDEKDEIERARSLVEFHADNVVALRISRYEELALWRTFRCNDL